MRTILQQPFPPHSLSGSIRMAALIGVFIAVFLLFFQPFGLHALPGGPSKVLAICGYGLVTFAGVSISSILLSKLFPAWFSSASWTVLKEIQITLFNFLLIGFFNTLYTFLIFRQPFSFSYLVYFEGITLAVGIFPVSIIVLFRYNRLLQTNLKLAQEMNSELKPPISQPVLQRETTSNKPESAVFTFTSETGTEQLTLHPHDFLFSVAADNYAEIHFSENGRTKKSLIRSSLTRLEEMVKTDPKIVRCHRAYLVNLNRVQHFSGNAQGLKLELSGTDELIPVSRKMVPEIKSLLHG